MNDTRRKVHKNRYKSNYKSGLVRKWAIALDVLHRRFKYRAISYQISKLSHTFFHNPQSIGQTKREGVARKKKKRKTLEKVERFNIQGWTNTLACWRKSNGRAENRPGIIRFQGNKAFSTKHTGTISGRRFEYPSRKTARFWFTQTPLHDNASCAQK